MNEERIKTIIVKNIDKRLQDFLIENSLLTEWLEEVITYYKGFFGLNENELAAFAKQLTIANSFDWNRSKYGLDWCINIFKKYMAFCDTYKLL